MIHMSQWKIRLGTMIAVLASGCIPSLYPLYTDKDLFFDPALIGTWVSKEGKVWNFAKGQNKTYDLVYSENECSVKFEAHLVRLGNDLFLDTFPRDSGVCKNDFYALHVIPAHIFLKVNIKEPELSLTMLNLDWFKEAIRNKKVRIKAEDMGRDQFLLTAPTKDLQAFISKYSNEAFIAGKGEFRLLRETGTATRPAVTR